MSVEFTSESAFASDRPTVLCVGSDEALLSYRAEVLRKAGFRVVVAQPEPLPKDGMRHQFADLCRLHGPSVLIACHSLSREQRIALAAQLRETCPGVKLLALTNSGFADNEAYGYDRLLDSLDGPAALIQVVRSSL